MKYLRSIIAAAISIGLSGILFALSAQQSPASEKRISQADPESRFGELYRSVKFETRGIPNLTVFTFSGDIEVVHNPAIDYVQVDLYLKRPFSLWSRSKSVDDYRIHLQQTNNDINASVEPKRGDRSLTGSELIFSFLVQTPDNVSTTLRTMNGDISTVNIRGQHTIQATSGDVALTRTSGEINAHTARGNIDITDSHGVINMKTAVGDVTIKNSSGEIRVRTASGDITGDSIEGSFICSTASGSVRTRFLHVAEGIYIETASGDIHLEVPFQYGFQLDARGIGLNLSGLRGFEGNVERSHARGTVGDAAIPIQLRSAAGNVTVRNNSNRPN